MVKIAILISLLIYGFLFQVCVKKEDFILQNKDKLIVASWEELEAQAVYISQGGMGSVSKIPWGLNTLGEPKFAVIKKAISQEFKQELKAEASILYELSVKHNIRYVPDFYACVEETNEEGLIFKKKNDDALYLVMSHEPYSFAQKIKLNDGSYIENEGFKKFQSLSPNLRFLVYKEIFDGLMRIHKAGYVHHDIKPENLVFTTNNDLGAKIIDFGVATPIDEGSNAGTEIYRDAVKSLSRYYNKRRNDKPVYRDLLQKFKKRTDHYKADIWSLVVTILVLEFPQMLPEIKAMSFEDLNAEESAREIADVIRSIDWKEDCGFKLCVEKLCFGNILKRMTEYNRVPIKFDNEMSSTNDLRKLAAIKQAVKAMKPEDHITMEKLFNDVNLIYTKHQVKLEQERKEFLYGETPIDHIRKTKKELAEIKKTLKPIPAERLKGIQWDQFQPRPEEREIVVDRSAVFSPEKI